jgi:hypothetical protein
MPAAAAQADGGALSWIERWSRDAAGECAHCREQWAEEFGPLDDDPRWDVLTGADERHYPPDRPVDFHHMQLSVDIPDMDTPRFRAVQRLVLSATGTAIETLRLDAVQLKIIRVADVTGALPAADMPHTRSDTALDVAIARVESHPPALPIVAWPPELTVAGRELLFSHDGSVLTIRFDPPLLASPPTSSEPKTSTHLCPWRCWTHLPREPAPPSSYLP